ncbi:Slp family lipoprotein [Sphingopyxis panaciterrae]
MQSNRDPAQEVNELETLRAITAAPLAPDQAVEKQHIGKRIRWAGGVHHVTRSDKGVCLTILYALSGEYGEPRWTLDPTYQTFDACTAGSYDPVLVHDFTNVTIVGKIAGKTYIGMGGGGSVGPVIAIENLYLWSDCLADDTSPICKRGFLKPEALPGD